MSHMENAHGPWVLLSVSLPDITTRADRPVRLDLLVGVDWYRTWIHRSRRKGETASVNLRSHQLRHRHLPGDVSRLTVLGIPLGIDHFAVPFGLEITATIRLEANTGSQIIGQLVGGYIRVRAAESTLSSSAESLQQLLPPGSETEAAHPREAITALHIGRNRLHMEVADRVDRTVRRLEFAGFTRSGQGQLWKLIGCSDDDEALDGYRRIDVAERLRALTDDVKSACAKAKISVAQRPGSGAIYLECWKESEKYDRREVLSPGMELTFPFPGGATRWAPRTLSVEASGAALVLTDSDADQGILSGGDTAFVPNVQFRCRAQVESCVLEAIKLPDLRLVSADPPGQVAAEPVLWQLARVDRSEEPPAAGARFDELAPVWLRYRIDPPALTPRTTASGNELPIDGLSGGFPFEPPERLGWSVQVNVPRRADAVQAGPRLRLQLQRSGAAVAGAAPDAVVLSIAEAEVLATSPRLQLLKELPIDPDGISLDTRYGTMVGERRLRFMNPRSDFVPRAGEGAAKGVVASWQDDDFLLSAAPGQLVAFLPARRALIDPVSASGQNLIARPELDLPLDEGTVLDVGPRTRKNPTSGEIEVVLKDGIVEIPSRENWNGLWIRITVPGKPFATHTAVIVKSVSGKLELDPPYVRPPDAGKETYVISPMRLALPRDPNHGLVPAQVTRCRFRSLDSLSQGVWLDPEGVIGTDSASCLALLPWAEWGPLPGRWTDTGTIRLHHRNLVLEHPEFEIGFADRFDEREVARAGGVSAVLPIEDFIGAVRDRYTVASGNLNIARPENGAGPWSRIRNWLPGSKLFARTALGTIPEPLRSELSFADPQPALLPDPFPEIALTWSTEPGPGSNPPCRPMSQLDQTLKVRKPGVVGDRHWLSYRVDVRRLVPGSAPELELAPTGTPGGPGSHIAFGSAAPMLFDVNQLASIARWPTTGKASHVAFASAAHVGTAWLEGAAPGLLTALDSPPVAALDLVQRSSGASSEVLAVLGLSSPDARTDGRLELVVPPQAATAAGRTAFRLPGSADRVQTVTGVHGCVVGGVVHLVGAGASAGTPGVAPRTGFLHVWKEGQCGAPIASQAFDFAVTRLAWQDGDDPLLLVGGEGGQVQLFKTASLELVDLLTEPLSGPVTAVALFRAAAGAPPRQCIAAAGPGGSLRVWEQLSVSGQKLIWSTSLPADITDLRFLLLEGMQLAREEGQKLYLLVASLDGRLRLLDGLDGRGPVASLALDAGVPLAITGPLDAAPASNKEPLIARILTASSRGQIEEWDLNSGRRLREVATRPVSASLDNLGIVRRSASYRSNPEWTIESLSAPLPPDRDATEAQQAFSALTAHDLALVVDAGADGSRMTEIRMTCESLKVLQKDGVLPEVPGVDGPMNLGTYSFHSRIRATEDALRVADCWPRLCGVPFFVTRLRALAVTPTESLVVGAPRWTASIRFEAVLLNPADLEPPLHPGEALGLPATVHRSIATGSVVTIALEAADGKPGKVTEVAGEVHWEFWPADRAIPRPPDGDATNIEAHLARLDAAVSQESNADEARLIFAPIIRNSRALVFERLWPFAGLPERLAASGSFDLSDPAAPKQSAFAIATEPEHRITHSALLKETALAGATSLRAGHRSRRLPESVATPPRLVAVLQNVKSGSSVRVIDPRTLAVVSEHPGAVDGDWFHAIPFWTTAQDPRPCLLVVGAGGDVTLLCDGQRKTSRRLGIRRACLAEGPLGTFVVAISDSKLMIWPWAQLAKNTPVTQPLATTGGPQDPASAPVLLTATVGADLHIVTVTPAGATHWKHAGDKLTRVGEFAVQAQHATTAALAVDGEKLRVVIGTAEGGIHYWADPSGSPQTLREKGVLPAVALAIDEKQVLVHAGPATAGGPVESFRIPPAAKPELTWRFGAGDALAIVPFASGAEPRIVIATAADLSRWQPHADVDVRAGARADIRVRAPVQLSVRTGAPVELTAWMTPEGHTELLVREGGIARPAFFRMRQGIYHACVIDLDAENDLAGREALVLWTEGDLDAGGSGQLEGPRIELLHIRETFCAKPKVVLKHGGTSIDLQGAEGRITLDFATGGNWQQYVVESWSLAGKVGTATLQVELDHARLKGSSPATGASSVCARLSAESADRHIQVPAMLSLSAAAEGHPVLEMVPWVYHARPIKPRTVKGMADVMLAAVTPVMHQVFTTDPDPSSAGRYVTLALTGKALELHPVEASDVPVDLCLDGGAAAPGRVLSRIVPQVRHRTPLALRLRYDAPNRSLVDAVGVAGPAVQVKGNWLLSPVALDEDRAVLAVEELWTSQCKVDPSGAKLKPSKDVPPYLSEEVLVLTRPAVEVSASSGPDTMACIGATTRLPYPGEHLCRPDPAELESRTVELVRTTGAAGVILVRQLVAAGRASYRFVASPFFAERLSGVARVAERARATAGLAGVTGAGPVIPQRAANTGPAFPRFDLDPRSLSPAQIAGLVAPSGTGHYVIDPPRQIDDQADCCALPRELRLRRAGSPDRPAPCANSPVPHLQLVEATAFRRMQRLLRAPTHGRIGSPDDHGFLPPDLEIRYGSDKPGGMLHHLAQVRLAGRGIDGRWTFVCEPPIEVALREPQLTKLGGRATTGVTLQRFAKASEAVLSCRTFLIEWDELIGALPIDPAVTEGPSVQLSHLGDRIGFAPRTVAGNVVDGAPLQLAVCFNQELLPVLAADFAVPSYRIEGRGLDPALILKLAPLYLVSRITHLNDEVEVRDGHGVICGRTRPLVRFGPARKRKADAGPGHPPGLLLSAFDAKVETAQQLEVRISGATAVEVVSDKPLIAGGWSVESAKVEDMAVRTILFRNTVSNVTWNGGKWKKPDGSAKGEIATGAQGSPVEITFAGASTPADGDLITLSEVPDPMVGDWRVRKKGASFNLLQTWPQVAENEPFEYYLLQRLESVFQPIPGADPQLRQAYPDPKQPPAEPLVEPGMGLQISWGGMVLPATGKARWMAADVFPIAKQIKFLTPAQASPKLAAVLLSPDAPNAYQRTMLFGDSAPARNGRLRLERPDSQDPSKDRLIYEIIGNRETVGVPVQDPAATCRLLLLKYLLGGQVVYDSRPLDP